MKNKILCSEINVAPNINLYHVGPSLDHGPLPSLFYFALSGPDSLCLDPFNQIVQFLQGPMIRVFSMTLPGHENGLPPTQALRLWAEDISKGIDPIGPFLDSAGLAVDFAIKEKFADPHKMAVAGLSRGGFIAAHLAAREERFRFILGFAPLTKINKARDFESVQDNPLVLSLNLENIGDKIADRHIRFYIGNNDLRVGTRACFDFAMQLSEMKRSAQVEMIISPSIGQMGHGTPPEIFKQGADWIIECLK